MRAKPRVGIEDELGVGQALLQADRVHGRDDEVVAPARIAETPVGIFLFWGLEELCRPVIALFDI